MRQEDLNEIMRLPWERKETFTAWCQCPKFGENYCGDGVLPCTECQHAQQQGGRADALLTLEERERWYTPAHVMFGWTQRLQRRHQPDEEHPIPITTEPTAAREPVQFGLFEEQRAA